MITLTTRQLYTSIKAFRALMDADSVPAAVGFSLIRLFKEVREALEAANKMQETIASKHALKHEDGSNKTLPNDKTAVLLNDLGQKELSDLMNVEIKFNAEKIPSEALMNATIKPIYLTQLEWLIA